MGSACLSRISNPARRVGMTNGGMTQMIYYNYMPTPFPLGLHVDVLGIGCITTRILFSAAPSKRTVALLHLLTKSNY